MTAEALASQTSQASLTAVVCAYTADRWLSTVAAVSSLQSQIVQPTQILLVIDYNRTLYLAARNHFRDIDTVTVLSNTGTPGLSGSRNTAVSAATGDVIAFLDDDARVAHTDWAGSLLNHFNGSDVQVIGGSAVPDWTATVADWLPPEFYWVVGCSFTGQPTTVAPVRNVLGCNMAVRRTALDAVGLFDSTMGRGKGRLPMGNEETDFCIRVNSTFGNSRVLYDPHLVVRHEVTSERTTLRYFIRRCYAEGLSKARLAQVAGTGTALSSERHYVYRTLPLGVTRELREAARGGEHRSVALARAGAIVGGLAITTVGYLWGRVSGLAHLRRR